MALNITFEGFVQEIKEFGWGTVVTVVHNHRSKNDATGQWETIGKDYLDVTTDGPIPAKDSKVLVQGRLKVSTYQKRDGSTGVALKVSGASISEATRGNSVAAVKEILEPLDPALPF
jgi:hypothetical protein